MKSTLLIAGDSFKFPFKKLLGKDYNIVEIKDDWKACEVYLKKNDINKSPTILLMGDSDGTLSEIEANIISMESFMRVLFRYWQYGADPEDFGYYSEGEEDLGAYILEKNPLILAEFHKNRWNKEQGIVAGAGETAINWLKEQTRKIEKDWENSTNKYKTFFNEKKR